MIDPNKLKFEPFHWLAHEEPTGYLPRFKQEPAAHACWYFYVLCQQSKEQIGKSIDDQFGLLEGELWLDPHYEKIARTVCMMYGLDSPDDFYPYWERVAAEASRCKLPIPSPVYMKRVRLTL